MINFKCPLCGGPTYVIDSRRNPTYTRRRRQCSKCHHKVTTIEQYFKEKFSFRKKKEKYTLPLYLFTTSLGIKRAIEASSKQQALDIITLKGWIQKTNWNLTYLGMPIRKGD